MCQVITYKQSVSNSSAFATHVEAHGSHLVKTFSVFATHGDICHHAKVEWRADSANMGIAVTTC